MKLEQLCVSLEFAKQLEKEGYSQNSLFYWVKNGDKYVVISDKELIKNGGLPTNINVYAAPTAAEIGEKLPQLISKKDELDYMLGIYPADGQYEVAYHDCDMSDETCITFSDKLLANAAAKMYLYLKKKKISTNEKGKHPKLLKQEAFI